MHFDKKVLEEVINKILLIQVQSFNTTKPRKHGGCSA